MRILYLIGNGFDLHVGLRTSFPDFLRYYLAQPIPDKLDDTSKSYIQRLKDDIDDNIQLWSNLELRYGHHMSKLGGSGKTMQMLQDELDTINDDIRANLANFIAEQDRHSFFDENAKKRFLEDIISPEKNLRDFERDNVNNYMSNLWPRIGNNIDIITFNYTRTIEHLLGKTSIQTTRFEIHSPVHVHGYHDSRMILGINDASQIENEQLRKLTYVTDALVKPDNNHSYGVAHTNMCDYMINAAQLICCYGLSFGDTDKLWWEKICNELRKRSELLVIVFAHSKKNIDFSNSGHKRENLMRQIKNHFLSQGGVDEPDRLRLSQRIYVSINDSIFNIEIVDKAIIDAFMDKYTLSDGFKQLKEIYQDMTRDSGNKHK